MYHTTDEIDEKLTILTEKYPNLIKETKFSARGKYGLLKFYDIGKNEEKSKENIFILGGEHAREMISVETVYKFLKNLLTKRSFSK